MKFETGGGRRQGNTEQPPAVSQSVSCAVRPPGCCSCGNTSPQQSTTVRCHHRSPHPVVVCRGGPGGAATTWSDVTATVSEVWLWRWQAGRAPTVGQQQRSRPVGIDHNNVVFHYAAQQAQGRTTVPTQLWTLLCCFAPTTQLNGVEQNSFAVRNRECFMTTENTT